MHVLAYDGPNINVFTIAHIYSVSLQQLNGECTELILLAYKVIVLKSQRL